MASKNICRHCGEIDCYEHCQKTDDGKHVPDMKTIAPASDSPGVVDVWCSRCEQSGSTEIKPEDVLWG